MNWSIVGSAATLVFTAVFAVVAFRLYHRLRSWYDRDPGRLWQPRPRWVIPSLAFGAAILAASWAGTYLGLVDAWATCIATGVMSVAFRGLVLLPHQGAQRAVMKDPLSYPLPETAREDQAKVALRLLGGLAVFIVALIGVLIFLASELF